MNELHSICIFCGSSSGVRPVYAEMAIAMGKLVATEGLRLVYGGGSIGLMGAMARAAQSGGASVLSVIPESLLISEGAGNSIGELIVCQTMLERKAIMADKADGFIALPGGYGTLDEIFEMITWTQLGIHAKPMGFLNVEGFFDPLLATIDQIIAEGFIRSRHRDLITEDADPAKLLEKVRNQTLPESVVTWKK